MSAPLTKRSSKSKESANAGRPSRVWKVALGMAFTIQLAALDLLIRGPSVYRDRPRMLGGLVASWALLALALRATQVSRKWCRVAVALALGALTASALGYYRYYHAPLDAQTAITARHAWADVKPMILRSLPAFGAMASLLSAFEFAWLSGSLPTTLRLRWLLAFLLLGAVVCGPLQKGTAEFRMAGAALALTQREAARPSSARPGLPELTSTNDRLPNILFIITESVRASDACLNQGCATGPELDRLLPDRITFTEARSLSSYTAIALSGVFTGQTQLQSRNALAKAPDLFDLAHAVHAQNSSYAIHYWSSQMAGVLERGGLESIADDTVTAETLLGHPLTDIEDAVAAVLDRRIGDVCEQRMHASQKPQFTVVHFSGTHAPYAFDEKTAPVQPWKRQVTWSGLSELHNAYLNSILEQDHTLGRCIAAFMKAVKKQPWVVIYTSDHGEAFGEHSAIHHGQNLYDEQIRVPLILAHGGGGLTVKQAEALLANAGHFTTHLDLVPTLADIWGIGHHFALQAWASTLPGQSLVAPMGPLRTLAISNCTELFPCPINTWGLLAEGKKLTAQSWDGNWRCFSLAGAETERPLAECTELAVTACRIFPRLPNGEATRGCN